MTAPARLTRLLLAAGLALALAAALLVGEPTPSRAAPDDGAASAAAKPKGGKGKQKGKISWDVTSFGPGGSVVAHGKLKGKGKRKIRLQVRTKGAWDTFGKTKTDRKGNFAISAPLKWYGEHKVRAITAGRRPFKKSTTVSVSTGYTPRGSADFAYNTSVNGGLRLLQDSCKTLKYVVNVDDVGQTGLNMVVASMDQLSYATGVKTKFVGLTSDHPFPADGTRIPGAANMIIGWASPAEEPLVNGNVGVTRYLRAKAARDRNGRGQKAYLVTDTAIVLNTDLWNGGTYSQAFVDTKRTFAKTVLHELGHAFGLDHVDPLEPMMHPGNIAPQPDGTYTGRYEASDLAGLAATGLGLGCVKPVRGAGFRGVITPPDVV